MIATKTRFCRLLRSLRVPALAVLGSAAAAFGGTALVANSPFSPSGALGAAAASSEDAFQLAGSTTQGTDVSVCIYAQQARHSQWIPVGGESDGIHVISFDAAHETAIVMVGGSRKELSMRKAVIASNGVTSASRVPQVYSPPAASPPPIAAAAPEPQVMDTVAREQREARMLVSDLLEIGVQQRKAYQEAKQKAASGTQPAQPEN